MSEACTIPCVLDCIYTNTMEKGVTDDRQLRSARNFLHRVIAHQRAATEELKSCNRELEAILEEVLAVRPDLRKIYNESHLESESAAPAAAQNQRAGRIVDMERLEQHTDRLLQKGHETIRESALLRLRSKRLRSALRVAAPHRAKAHSAPLPLSKRERQVLALIVEGKSSKEIAAELGISFKTAVTHRSSIMAKLDVHEIASVVREAIRRGLV